MRYSVTVKRQEDVIPSGHSSRTSAVDPDPLGRGSYVSVVSRRTGLTLDEARFRAHDAVFRSEARQGKGLMLDSFDKFYPECETLPEAGGTVGPLPDGKLIVVEREGMG
jgi:hypothetical protein